MLTPDTSSPRRTTAQARPTARSSRAGDIAEGANGVVRFFVLAFALTALAAMIGAVFILDDPIFNGLAISLIFGIFVSTVLTLVVIPVLYYAAMRGRIASLKNPEENPA